MEVDEDVVGISVDLMWSHGLQPDEDNDIEPKDGGYKELCCSIYNSVLLNVSQEVNLILFILVCRADVLMIL